MRAGARMIWASERTHRLSWILSVETARRHYPDIALVTDSAGARELCDGLGLEFGSVSTELDALEQADSRWWSLGKLLACRAQRAPFVHLDPDVFLWKRLPAIVEHAPVLAQSPEALIDHQFYEPERMLRAFEETVGRVPEPWAWYVRRGFQTAACCGIVGGTDVELLHEWADMAIDVALNPRHRAVWEREQVQLHMMLVEQYLFVACVEHRRAHDPRRRDLRIQYLFPNANFADAAAIGYTHAIADAKRNPEVVARIEAVVRRDHPAHYARCLALEERTPAGAPVG